MAGEVATWKAVLTPSLPPAPFGSHFHHSGSWWLGTLLLSLLPENAWE